MMGSLLCSVTWSGSNHAVPQITSWPNSIPWMDCVDFPFLSGGDYFWLLLCWVFRNNAAGNVDVCVFFVSHGNGNSEADVGGKEEACPVYSNRKAVVHSEK